MGIDYSKFGKKTETKKEEDKPKYYCKYCGKEYSSESWKTRHEEQECPKNEELQKRLEEEEKKRQAKLREEEERRKAKLETERKKKEALEKEKAEEKKTIEELKKKVQDQDTKLEEMTTGIKDMEDILDEVYQAHEQETESKMEYIILIKNLENEIESLNADKPDLNELYEKRKKAFKSKAKPFELDVHKLVQYIIHNYKKSNVKNFTTLPKLRQYEVIKKTGVESPDMQVAVDRVHSGRTSFIESYVEIINEHPDKFVKDEFIPQKLDSLTLEIIKDFLLQILRDMRNKLDLKAKKPKKK